MVRVQVKTKKRHDTAEGIEDGVQAGISEYLTILQSQSKLLAPVDTGLLRGSLNKRLKGFIGKLFTKTEYALFQEEGTSRMSAANQGKGFMAYAVELTKNKIVAIFGRSIRKGIRRN